MTALSTQLALRAHDLIGDGKWHPYEQIVRELCKLVPPGQALRRNERERLQAYAQHKKVPQPRRSDVDTYRRVQWGARAIVREFFKTKIYETRGQGKEREIRQLAPPRVLKRESVLRELDELRNQVELLRDQLGETAELAADEWLILMRTQFGPLIPQIVRAPSLVRALVQAAALPLSSWVDDDSGGMSDE